MEREITRKILLEQGLIFNRRLEIIKKNKNGGDDKKGVEKNYGRGVVTLKENIVVKRKY